MTINESFPQTDRNRVRQVAKRGSYDRATIYRLFDQAWVCHVSFTGQQGPTTIPMFHARIGDEIIFHGSSKSRLLLRLVSGQPICLSVAIADGLVLARSLFHHSMNYRSAVAFGSGREITDDAQRTAALTAISDKVMPGRWDDARQPSTQELKATMIAAVSMESASAKIRQGGPVDDAEDYELDVWAGVVPFRHVMDSPIADTECRLPQPDYLQRFVSGFNLLGNTK